MNAANGRILLVEDEELIGTMIQLNLQQEGFEVTWHKEGSPVLDGNQAAQSDVVVLDIMLPDVSGIEILRSLRKQNVGAPVLMLTAKGHVDSKIRALDLGADDYLTKPFDIQELSARIRALIRRSQSERHLPSQSQLTLGTYRINLETRIAGSSEGEVTLSAKEVDLLSYFSRNTGRPLSRADILEEVWGMDVSVTERTVDNFLVRFRKLFEQEPENPRHFITVRGLGYRFENAD